MEKAYKYLLAMIAHGKTELGKCKDEIAIAYSFDELIANRDNGKMSAVLTVEEGGILNGKMEYLDELYHQGIRLITLTWNYENCIGFPNSREPELMNRGLKPFGMEVVRHMNELGMIIDVSHLSDGGFWDVAAHSTKPFLASHSNARTLCKHPRNLTDEMIKALAEKGGVRIYNMKEELEGVFAVLKDKNRFQSAFIDEFGNVAWDIDDSIDSSTHWENRIDICKDALYMDSIPVYESKPKA